MQSQSGLPLFPEQASTVSAEVDALYFFFIVVTFFFTIGIFATIFYFAIKYKRKSETEMPKPIEGSMALEALWIGIPLALTMVMFFWGTSLFFKIARPPQTSDAIDIYVTSKRWMWKLQHVDGQREINQLHIPIGRPVRLTMTSEDVIHSFYVPAFRVKGDVIPGRYSKIWFEAVKTGTYHLFCAEYCGTKHSEMIGSVVVMEPSDFQNWLSGGAGSGSLSQIGQKLFTDLACNNCHRDDAQGRGPSLKELFGTQIELQDGRTLIADESYIRESILQPNAKLAKGFEAIMPTFQGLVSEEQVLQLIAYIRSIGPKPKPAPKPAAGQTAKGQTAAPSPPQSPPAGAKAADRNPTPKK